MAVNDGIFTCSLGLIVAKLEYLHGGSGNRDTKRGVSTAGFANILWLVADEPFPPSRYAGLDMDRFRQLRRIKSGNERAAQFCRENLRSVVHRDVMQSLLHDQYDFMKRLRANGGAPDSLAREGIAILIGTFAKDKALASLLGIHGLRRDEIVALAPRSSDEWEVMTAAGLIETGTWTS